MLFALLGSVVMVITRGLGAHSYWYGLWFANEAEIWAFLAVATSVRVAGLAIVLWPLLHFGRNWSLTSKVASATIAGAALCLLVQERTRAALTESLGDPLEIAELVSRRTASTQLRCPIDAVTTQCRDTALSFSAASFPLAVVPRVDPGDRTKVTLQALMECTVLACDQRLSFLCTTELKGWFLPYFTRPVCARPAEEQ